MLRTRCFLVAIFFAMPMLRECCFSTVPPYHCHQSQNTENKPCFSNQDAITENRSTLAFFTVPFEFPVTAIRAPWQFESAGSAADELTLTITHTVDLYLRTGALLL